MNESDISPAALAAVEDMQAVNRYLRELADDDRLREALVAVNDALELGAFTWELRHASGPRLVGELHRFEIALEDWKRKRRAGAGR